MSNTKTIIAANERDAVVLFEEDTEFKMFIIK
jgi:hypothetical protein